MRRRRGNGSPLLDSLSPIEACPRLLKSEAFEDPRLTGSSPHRLARGLAALTPLPPAWPARQAGNGLLTPVTQRG